MAGTALPIGHGKLTTPRAAAVAGIVFAVLMGTAYVLARLAVPADATERKWLDERADLVQLGLGLVPFAGIAFLWFIGVIRDRVGALEDRFFSTVLLGSGLLYLAMTFVSVALAGGILTAYEVAPTQAIESGLYDFDRSVVYRTSSVFALRMGAVFMISAGTIWLRYAPLAAVGRAGHLRAGTLPAAGRQLQPLGHADPARMGAADQPRVPDHESAPAAVVTAARSLAFRHRSRRCRVDEADGPLGPGRDGFEARAPRRARGHLGGS